VFIGCAKLLSFANPEKARACSNILQTESQMEFHAD